jgi:transcriptional regulator with XRE-family HTH domain
MTATMPLHLEASMKLGLNQRETANVCGISLRTVQRWSSRQAHPSSFDYRALAAKAVAVDHDLATRLATAASTTLAELGLVAAPQGPQVPQSVVPTDLVIDSILCAAAIAIDMKPLEIRPALAAAFRRARQLGIALEVVEKALTGEFRPDPLAGEAKPAKGKK